MLVLDEEFYNHALQNIWIEYEREILLSEDPLIISSGAIDAPGKKTEEWQRRRRRRKLSKPNELE